MLSNKSNLRTTTEKGRLVGSWGVGTGGEWEGRAWGGRGNHPRVGLKPETSHSPPKGFVMLGKVSWEWGDETGGLE